MGRFWMAEAGIGYRAAPQAKHRASRTRLQVVVGHIRMLGEYHEPEGRGTDDRLAPPGWH